MHAIAGYLAPAVRPALFPSAHTDIDLKADAVLAQLDWAAPFVTPAEIGPVLGIGAAGFRYHCQNCKYLRSWQGNYRFMLDDRQHVQALRAVVKLALWSGTKVPQELKPSRGTVQRAAKRVQ